MKKAPIYSQEGKKLSEVDLNHALFNVKIKPELVQQAVVTQRANQRQVLAHTKDRSEVRGGGAKPWRQKGTGRARQGSIRSPLWKGGGVVFGPRKDRNFKLKISKKAKRKALFMALSDHANNSKVIILESLKLAKIKTKELLAILKKLPIKEKKTLLVLSQNDPVIKKSARNLPKLICTEADSLNLIDILNTEYLLILKDGLKKMEEVYLKK